MTPTTRSRDVILREEDFKPLLAQASASFGGWAAAVREDARLLGAGHVLSKLVEDANALETFLDDHGAGSNRSFATFRELVASIRGLALATTIAVHLQHRLRRYETQLRPDDLLAALGEAREILDRSLLALLGSIEGEAERLGMTWTARPVALDGELRQRRLLPRNLDEEEVVDERERLVKIASRYLKVVEGSRSLGVDRVRRGDELLEFVGRKVNEERCRYYESSVHNIQSSYDTYVLDTALERDHPWLKHLRGHASVAFHLLEMATLLIHFYERHEDDIRHEETQDVISAVVSKQDILHVAVNVCLRHAYFYVEASGDLAHRILRTFVVQGETSIEIPEGISLHARPLALIVQVAKHYGTPLEVGINGDACSADSIMELILLSSRHPGARAIRFQGQQQALDDLSRLFSAGLGEDGRALPPELGYLQVDS